MMRSLFSAISGLRNHQTFMDVVGNNIANVNTTGFKQSRVTFQDILSQTIHGASSPQGGRGGINPAQVGLGMVLGGIDTVQTQGMLQSTGKMTDMAIQGDGYFVLSDGANQYFTRDGGFDLGTDGTLVSPASGLKVMGWQADKNGVVDTSRPVGSLTVPIGQGMEGQVSKTATITGNLNADIATSSIASSNPNGGKLTASFNTTPPAGVSYKLVVNDPVAQTFDLYRWDPTGAGSQVTVGTAMTTAQLANITGDPYLKSLTLTSATNLKAGDMYLVGGQSSTVTLYDSLGGSHSVRLLFQKTPGTTSNQTSWKYWAVTDGTGTTPVFAAGTNAGAGVAIAFDSAGKITTGSTGSLALTAANTALSNGAQDMSVLLDLTGVTSLSGTGELAATTDGAAAGTLSSFSIGQGGDIVGIYSNGLKQTLGQMALAGFTNPTGLTKNGGNLFSASVNSGTARVGTPGTNGRGQISTGFLEMSNVDLAQQFTNMIMAERGFQANSRVISASDEILQDLINMKR